MKSVTGYEGIVDGLGKFVAQGSDVLELRAENASTNPTGEGENIAFLTKSVVFIPGLEIVGVEAEHTALIGVAIGIEIGVLE